MGFSNLTVQMGWVESCPSPPVRSFPVFPIHPVGRQSWLLPLTGHPWSSAAAISAHTWRAGLSPSTGSRQPVLSPHLVYTSGFQEC